MADDIAVTLLLTRDGIDVTNEIDGGRILNAPAGDYVATWTASDGVLPSVTQTESLTVEEAASGEAPTVIGSIADRTYTVGQTVPATDLRTKFEGATSYVISPAVAAAVIDGYDLAFDASSALEETSFAVRGVNAAGQSEPVTFKLTVQPALTATPPALTAGQQASIPFNTTPDSVTVTQGGTTLTATRVGTTNEWTFTPLTTDPVSISATKAGWSPYSTVIENVQPAPPEIAVTSDNTAELRNVTSNTAPFDLTINAPARYAGPRQVNPADGISGPIRHVAPVITGNAVVGQVLTLDPGFWLTLAGDMDLSWTWPDGSTGLTYVVRPQDAGTGVTIDGDAVDANGTKPMQANSIAIPAAVLIDTFGRNETNINGQAFESGRVWTLTTTAGQVEALNGELITRATGAYVSGDLDQGPNQYIEADVKRGSAQGVWIAVRVQADPVTPTLRRGLYVNVSASDLQMRYINAAGGASALGSVWAFPTDGSWDVGESKRVGLGIVGTAATIYVDGVAVRTGTYTDLSGGGAGVLSNGNAGTSGTTLDNISIRSEK